MIDIKDHQRYDSEGKLIMTTVSYAPVTALQALCAWFDPGHQVVHEDALFPRGRIRRPSRHRAVSQMDTSKINATFVVMQELTDYPKEHGDGALIQATIEGCPAFDELFAGDLITAVDGERRRIEQAGEQGDRRGAGSTSRSRSPCARRARPTTYRSPGSAVRAERSRALRGHQHDQPVPVPGDDLQRRRRRSVGRTDVLVGSLRRPHPGRPHRRARRSPAPGRWSPTARWARSAGSPTRWWRPNVSGATVFLVPEDNMAELEGVDVGEHAADLRGDRSTKRSRNSRHSGREARNRRSQTHRLGSHHNPCRPSDSLPANAAGPRT